MIVYKQGNLFSTSAEAIVNTVNCVGIMGRGIALQFKKLFPENFTSYAMACKQGKMVPGKMLVFEKDDSPPLKYIINFPTKRHWREKSRIEDIERGLEDLVQVILSRNIQSIAIPPLGCGLGGLDWTTVKSRMEQSLCAFNDVVIEIYEPGNASDAEAGIQNRTPPAMTPGRAALIVLIQKYLNGLLDPFITLLEVHKLMYFLQDCGENLRLQYKKYIYGPYAENLRHVLNAMEGYYISGYADGGDDPYKVLQLMPGIYEKGEKFLLQYPETLMRMNKVCLLMEGFETAFGLELLSTVHWLVKNEGCCSLSQIIQGTYQWNEHKKQFSERQLKLAAQRLMDLGWTGDIQGME